MRDCRIGQGASEEAAEAEVAPSEDDPQPVTEEEYAERDQLLKAGVKACVLHVLLKGTFTMGLTLTKTPDAAHIRSQERGGNRWLRRQGCLCSPH